MGIRLENELISPYLVEKALGKSSVGASSRLGGEGRSNGEDSDQKSSSLHGFRGDFVQRTRNENPGTNGDDEFELKPSAAT